MVNEPNPKNFETKKEYMDAVRERLDYGYCNPRKARFADEDEREASRRWDEQDD